MSCMSRQSGPEALDQAPPAEPLGQTHGHGHVLSSSMQDASSAVASTSLWTMFIEPLLGWQLRKSRSASFPSQPSSIVTPSCKMLQPDGGFPARPHSSHFEGFSTVTLQPQQGQQPHCDKTLSQQLRDNLSRQTEVVPTWVNKQGLPWPCIDVHRRSTLRFHAHWHGLRWPKTKELSLDLSHHD